MYFLAVCFYVKDLQKLWSLPENTPFADIVNFFLIGLTLLSVYIFFIIDFTKLTLMSRSISALNAPEIKIPLSFQVSDNI